ncbi:MULTISPECIES: acyl-CoA thioesterase [Novosphingobium]|jgi:4-hydroxybenzoyl-CoA thioesterase|uniref:acyl-CoA thioesterase n=1 Tax=Novosphingobium TaxID=165696 RepID=UPI0022F25887|nr:thioesterase family protein [Novosphingobium resinovorum]GLK45824.1 4-hydroxybenzoyl-CoA thioesterase [Novosphingobium resinovorum]
MPFTTSTQVRFAHVDPAGIVFYPRYFEMLNGAVEDWFAQDLGMDFASMHLEHHIGVPTVKLDVEFVSPSRLGDRLEMTVTAKRLGRTSCGIEVVFAGEGRDRLRAQVVLVCMDLNDHRPVEWPVHVRERIEAGLVPA